jgi:hypothetical protein
LRTGDDLDLILTCRVPRRVSKVLTVQYDRVIYLLEDTVANRSLIHSYLDVFEYPDGRIEIRVNGAALPCVPYDRLSEIDQAAVVDNKVSVSVTRQKLEFSTGPTTLREIRTR